MLKVAEIKEAKEQLTLEQFVSIGRTIANIYKDDEGEQAKAIGRYFDSVCRAER
jgi:hypothetical protein